MRNVKTKTGTELNNIEKNVVHKFVMKNLSTFVEAISEMNDYARMMEEEGMLDFQDALFLTDGTVIFNGENMDYPVSGDQIVVELKGEDVWYNEPETIEEIVSCMRFVKIDEINKIITK